MGHLGHIIKEYFGDGSAFGVTISYFEETQPLGTAGALFQMDELTEDFLLMCGDLILDVDFKRFIDFHKEHNALASLIVHPNDHPFDSSLIVTETLPPQKKGGLPVETSRVNAWLNKEDERLYYKNCVNAGIEIISPELLRIAKAGFGSDKVKFDLDRDILKPNIATKGIFAYSTTEYIKDMGTPERYLEVEQDLISGKVVARCLRNKQVAVFLDRDGVINYERGFINNPSNFELIAGMAEAIKKINQSGRLAVVVTNQPVIARGECSFDTLRAIHNKLETELGKEGAYVDGIYYCPHHPDKGFDGELPEYKLDCDCRKPKQGLLLQAANELNIDLQSSIVIGDSERDVDAGNNAGCAKSILIKSNEPNALLEVISMVCGQSADPSTQQIKR